MKIRTCKHTPTHVQFKRNTDILVCIRNKDDINSHRNLLLFSLPDDLCLDPVCVCRQRHRPLLPALLVGGENVWQQDLGQSSLAVCSPDMCYRYRRLCRHLRRCRWNKSIIRGIQTGYFALQ